MFDRQNRFPWNAVADRLAPKPEQKDEEAWADDCAAQEQAEYDCE